MGPGPTLLGLAELSDRELCMTIKDPKKNHGMTMKRLIEHNAKDPNPSKLPITLNNPQSLSVLKTNRLHLKMKSQPIRKRDFIPQHSNIFAK